jgi:hypothetical protein
VIKESKILRKQTVDLAPAPVAARKSRIRRDPPAAVVQKKAVNPYPSEREVWTVAIGVISFAIAIAIVIFRFSAITGQ